MKKFLMRLEREGTINVTIHQRNAGYEWEGAKTSFSLPPGRVILSISF